MGRPIEYYPPRCCPWIENLSSVCQTSGCWSFADALLCCGTATVCFSLWIRNNFQCLRTVLWKRYLCPVGFFGSGQVWAWNRSTIGMKWTSCEVGSRRLRLRLNSSPSGLIASGLSPTLAVAFRIETCYLSGAEVIFSCKIITYRNLLNILNFLRRNILFYF